MHFEHRGVAGEKYLLDVVCATMGAQIDGYE